MNTDQKKFHLDGWEPICFEKKGSLVFCTYSLIVIDHGNQRTVIRNVIWKTDDIFNNDMEVVSDTMS